MKTLEELRMEIDLEIMVYCSLYADMRVYIGMREIDGDPWYNYLFSYMSTSDVKSVSGTENELTSHMARPVLIEVGYEKLDNLIADWPIASQSVWTLLPVNKAGKINSKLK